MDKVRLGRALGYGARHAAKTVMQAVEAATTPDPGAAARPANNASAANRASTPHASELAQALRRTPAAAEQARTAADSFAEPLRRASSVVFLQVTGSFFGLLTAIFGAATWREAGGWRIPAARGHAAWLFALTALTGLFAYFCVANFIRARRRERRGR